MNFVHFCAIGLTCLTTCAKIQVGMKIGFFKLFKGEKTVKTITDYKQEILVKAGREQFKKLLEKGISVPVVLL